MSDEITDEMLRVAVDAFFANNNQVRAALAAVAPLIRAQEREACAKVADSYPKGDPLKGAWIAAAIRARGETK